jgi:hypothetical protein
MRTITTTKFQEENHKFNPVKNLWFLRKYYDEVVASVLHGAGTGVIGVL